MPRSNDEKTREFQQKMRTQGAAGFAAGPWKEIEESLGMDQSVVVDQDGNPVWSVKHTRKPHHTVSRSAFDRMVGGVAVLAIATLVTSVLAIYFEQTVEPDSSLLARPDTPADMDAVNTLTLPPPPATGFIDRPAVEVVARAETGRDSMQGAPDGDTPAAGTAESPADPAISIDTQPQLHALDSTSGTEDSATPAETLSALAADPVEAIEAITRQESPAAIGGPAVSESGNQATPELTATDPEPPAVATGTQMDIAVEDSDMAAATPAATEPLEAPAVMADTTLASADTEVPGDTSIRDDVAAVATPDAMESSDLTETASPDPAAAVMTDSQQATATPDTGAMSAEETRATGMTTLAQLEPAVPAPSPASAAVAELGDATAVTMDDVPQPGTTGRWIINLASYSGPKTAGRMQRKFENLGVSTEQQVAEVKGKTMYRLRIASFTSRADAEAYFDSIKDTLGLESAWITKK